MNVLPDRSLAILDLALDGLAHREQAVATNLSNVDTPGYQPVSVNFEDTLQGLIAQSSGSSGGAPSGSPAADVALRTTDVRHFASPDGTVPTRGGTVDTFSGSLRNDGNAVDLESEMTALAETQLKFGAVSRLVTGKVEMLRTVITDRG